jgi:hypothetical protein
MSIVISFRQMDTFKRNSIDCFVRDAMHYLDQALGDNTAFYGQEAVVDTIYYGINRAAAYGIIGRHDVCLYLRLMFSLMGSDFDQDPLYPWTTDILSDTFNPPNDKIMLLVGKADEFLATVSQREPQYLKGVIAVTRFNLFTELPDDAALPTIEATVLTELQKWFLGKAACVGKDNIKSLIIRGVDDARTHGLKRGQDIAAFIQFMFLYGVRFYADPKYPQARAIFSDPVLTGAEKIAAMFIEGRNFLHRKLTLLRA